MEEYVSGRFSQEDVAERMVMSGSNIEAQERFGTNVTGVVIGKVLEVWPHPDSDHLVVCRVDVTRGAERTAHGAIDELVAAEAAAATRGERGEREVLQIVTGAPNVSAGDFVPVAVHGAALPGGVTIKKGKLRGEVSEGMICSAQELGFDDKVVPMHCKDGIWTLPKEFRADKYIGTDALDALGLRFASVIDFEITPNRPDCLSIYGMAREYAAVYDRPLEPIEVLAREDASLAGAGQTAEDFVKVQIAKPELCPRYIARVATDVVIEDSPWWMQQRLMLAGMRPINNIVDITNYVMLELGHPIHAFDITEIAGGEILVDTAAAGEKFTTLDGTERTLDADTLLIKDGRRGVAIAGVMGGLNSEITDATTTILIEAACFTAAGIRRTSKKLGLRTEASSRYEKGVPAELAQTASDRVCQLIQLTGAGKVLPGAADCYPAPQAKTTIMARAGRINAVLGTGISADDMAALLRRLEMGVEVKGEQLLVTPPAVRIDLKEEIDLSEEVARLYGYDKLPASLHADSVSSGVSKSWFVRGILREVLTGAGLSEIATYSFVSPEGVALIGAQNDPKKTDFVRLLNPLGEENSVMRTTLLPNMLEVLARNFNRGNEEAFLFEIGNTFHATSNNELPSERLSLCAAWYLRGGGADFFLLKGVLEKAFARLGLGAPALVPTDDLPTWHPGRCAAVAEYGVIGELHPDVSARYGIEERVVAFELDFDALAEAAVTAREYSPLPKFPAAPRDIALIVDEDVTAGRLEAVIREKGGRTLESVALFDIYRGKQVPEGKKSLAFSLTFRAKDRTLTDEEVNKTQARIVKALESETGAALRDA
jgi:phenylalanyl-tRNA synthetase beta chain